MVHIERSFLRSRVARRVFFLFILCALLPVGALSVVSFGDVTSQLTQQSERRVRQESKAMGMAIYQRLLLLESEVLAADASSGALWTLVTTAVRDEANEKVPPFVGIARMSTVEPPTILIGKIESFPSFSASQWELLRDQKTLLITAARDAQSRRIFLAHASKTESFREKALLAEVNGAYLWGLAGSMVLPAETTMCVFVESGEPLFCSDGVQEQMKAGWAQRVRRDSTSVFEWSDGQDSYLAGFWTIPLRYEFGTVPWAVVLSEPRSSVLAPLSSFKYRFSLVVLVAVLFVALLSVNQIRKTMVPLEELGEGTRRIARCDFSTPVRVSSGDEFEELAASFNAMGARIAQQFTQLATIHEIDRSVLSVLDPSRIVDTVLVRLREVSPCEAIAVLLIDPSERGRGWLYSRIGARSTPTQVAGVSIDDAACRAFLKHPDRVLLTHETGGEVFGKLCVPGVTAVVAFPLFRAKELLGCIALGYAQFPSGSEDGEDQLRRLADQVAVALSNASDLAERKRAEGRLRDANTQLESALTELKAAQQQMVQQERLRALGQMASGIAHDFNNTLSPIVGFSELLLIDPNMSDNKALLNEYLQTINLAAKDAAKVVSRLREFYRPRFEADLTGMVDMNRLVEQAVKLTQPKWKDQALANGVTIDLHVDLEAVPPVVGHESELREVLTNLVFNAVDAMPKSGSITLRTKVDGNAVRLEVSDTGTGMTEEVRQRCLEPFFSTKGEKGSGLGLAMVYGIIRRLGGSIDIVSEVGKGTTFSLRLPVQTDARSDGAQESAPSVGLHLRVLVVDDDPLVGRVTSEYLRVAGHEVQCVAGGAEAVKAFNPEQIDLVVTDHGMPHMSGLQLASVIKELSRDTRVILLTGGDQTEDAETNTGTVDALLSKPLTMMALQQALAALRFPRAAASGNRKEIGDAA